MSEQEGGGGGSRASAAPRLLILTPDFPPAHGGIQLLMHRLAAGFDGLRVRVLAPAGPGAAAFDSASGLDTVRAPGPGGSAHLRILALNAAALAQARRWRPDAILSAHVVCSPAAAAVRRLHRTPVVQYFHANEIAGKRRLSAFAARSADAVIAVSAYTEQLVAATGAVPADLRVIPPGVDLPEQTARLPSERPTILTVGRMRDAYKGHDVMIRSLPRIRERVPDVEWVVIGDGPLRTSLEQLARDQGVAGAVRFLGPVEDSQRDAWLRRAEVFSMPSRLPGGGLAGEGFGIVFMEAAAHGIPVVAGNAGGAVDAVADGETGMLVDPADPEAVAAANSSLLLDPALRERMGAAALRWAREFRWPAICARVEAVVLEQLERR